MKIHILQSKRTAFLLACDKGKEVVALLLREKQKLDFNVTDEVEGMVENSSDLCH